MLIRAEGCTDTGVVREHNEDAFMFDIELGFFAVADGMGGHLAGEVASRMAVDVLRDYLTRASIGNDPLIGASDDRYTPAANQLASGIRLANRVIFEAAQSDAAWRNMGSTIVAVRLDRTRMVVAHVGDSRVYLIRGASMTQITADHSLVAEQQRKGLISKEEARTSHLKNVITRALGQYGDVEVDLNEVEVLDGDRILLCSDGLTNMVSDNEILTVVTGEDDPGKACSILTDKANENGGRDNITSVLVYVTVDGFFNDIRRFLGRGK